MSDLSTLRTAKTQAEALVASLDMLISLAEMEATSDATTGAAEPEPAAVDPNDPENYFADYGLFYDHLRGNKLLGPKITTSEFTGCDAIIRACAGAGYPISFTAYALATAYLETAATMQPIKEYGGNAYFTRMYDIKGARPNKARELGNLTPGDGAKYCGRGYPQLTGKSNYRKATEKLRALGYNVDLVSNPEDALKPEIAAPIMALGMLEGWFTGRKLGDDLPAGEATHSQFLASRDIINGKDRQKDVADYAMEFQAALKAGGYRIVA